MGSGEFPSAAAHTTFIRRTACNSYISRGERKEVKNETRTFGPDGSLTRGSDDAGFGLAGFSDTEDRSGMQGLVERHSQANCAPSRRSKSCARSEGSSTRLHYHHYNYDGVSATALIRAVIKEGRGSKQFRPLFAELPRRRLFKTSPRWPFEKQLVGEGILLGLVYGWSSVLYELSKFLVHSPEPETASPMLLTKYSCPGRMGKRNHRHFRTPLPVPRLLDSLT